MKNNIELITGAEWNVMRIVWSLGSASTRTIIENLQAASDWKDSTIKTLLARLVKKGFLTSEKDGRQFVYRALVPEQTAMNQSADELFSHLCKMKSGKTSWLMVSGLTASTQSGKVCRIVMPTSART